MYGSVVVSVLVLASSIGIAIAATTSNPSAGRPSRQTGARNATNNGGKVVTLRQSFGNTEEQCQCVISHLCDPSNVISVSTGDNQDRCGDSNVCCRMDSSSLPAASNSPPSTADQSNCICVPFWQCIDYQQSPVPPSEEENIENIINPRFRCEPPDFCCPPTSINTNSSVVTDFSTPSSVITPSPPVVVDTPTQPGTDVRAPTSSESSVPVPSAPAEQECGIKGKSPNTASESDIDAVIDAGVRITNTNDENAGTYFGEFPWMVALFRTNGYNGDLICGASLLSPYIVLTAAHCVNNIDMSLLRVRAGEYIIGSEENETLPHQDRTVNAVHIHPNYNPKRLYNDMALLSVSEPFRYDTNVNGICTPLAGTDFAAPNSYRPTNCWATGWGKHNFTDSHTQLKLKKVELPIVNRDECQKTLRTTKLGTNFNLDSSFLCAGGQKGFDACKGDGGGPLFCASRSNENKFIQVGIVSWGVGCGNEIPGIYASLEANSDWLTTEINTMSVFRPI